MQLHLLDAIEEAAEGEMPSEEAVADLIQTEMVAHIAWSGVSRKGKGKGGKSKGKRK